MTLTLPPSKCQAAGSQGLAQFDVPLAGPPCDKNRKLHLTSGKRLHSYGKSPSLSSVNQLFPWAMFNSYVKLPEGIEKHVFCDLFTCGVLSFLNTV